MIKDDQPVSLVADGTLTAAAPDTVADTSAWSDFCPSDFFADAVRASLDFRNPKVEMRQPEIKSKTTLPFISSYYIWIT